MKKPIADPQSCASCRVWVAQPGDAAGECKRFPPVPIVVDDALACVFPVVNHDDICG